MSYLANQQVIILKEGSSRNRGKDAQRGNISAARIVSEVVKTTLGPRGMDKMMVDSLGDVTITSDGATVLDELDVQHPAAKMLVEVAKTQDDEVGDGTTTSVVLAGELLKRAEFLLDQGVHPTVINAGYKKAGERAREILNEISKPVDLKDTETLRKVAITAMRGKSLGGATEHFAKIAVQAVNQIIEKRGDSFVADIDNIQLVKKEGKSLMDTELVNGVIIDKEVVHPGMPKRMQKARIALLDTAMEIEKTEFSAEIKISNPQQMQSFLDEETKLMKDMVDKVAEAGANVVLCQKGIDEIAQSFMAKQGILAARRIKKSDIEKLSRATGGRIVTNLEDLRASDLGNAGLVEERKIGDDKMIFIEDAKDPKSVSILIRAGLERMVDEAERSLKDALSVVIDVVKKNKIVAGGGAVETELAKRIRDYATKIGGREQLAVEAFADAMEAIPRTLSENAGLDQVDILVALRAAHEAKGLWSGINVYTGEITDMMKEGVLEPVKVKEHAIGSAVEVASMILRIDDVIAAAKPPPMPRGQGPPPD
ncbi:thermosome subunit [Candidatus Bathyarchaeota archaeon]|nr:MAG: thermosome subunit [Candidatus Bathyarchaeota archaeon]TMI68188.1 MAG: thermosome subunit [Candidatus Bathyarchaeota archaeon]